MKVILSYPYSGSLYWWFQRQRQPALEKKPTLSYYAALFGDVERHLDVALACALIYEEFVMPVADAVYPGLGDLSDFSLVDLGLQVSEWDVVHEAHKLTDPVVELWQTDPVLYPLLNGRSVTDVGLELLYAAADVLLAAEHDAPVLCSDGRRAVVRRLMELGVVTAPASVASAFNSDKLVSEMVDSYANLVGMTFGADNIGQFIDLKWMSPLRDYADGFQRTLESPSTKSVDDLYQAIAAAMESKALAERVAGAFEATGRVMNLAGVVPGIGSAASIAGLTSSAGSATAGKRVTHMSWFELSSAVKSARDKHALEDELRRRGHL